MVKTIRRAPVPNLKTFTITTKTIRIRKSTRRPPKNRPNFTTNGQNSPKTRKKSPNGRKRIKITPRIPKKRNTIHQKRPKKIFPPKTTTLIIIRTGTFSRK